MPSPSISSSSLHITFCSTFLNTTRPCVVSYSSFFACCVLLFRSPFSSFLNIFLLLLHHHRRRLFLFFFSNCPSLILFFSIIVLNTYFCLSKVYHEWTVCTCAKKNTFTCKTAIARKHHTLNFIKKTVRGCIAMVSFMQRRIKSVICDSAKQEYHWLMA